MFFFKSAVLFGMLASVYANPIPGGSETQLDTRMASGVKIKDTTCPEYKITYTAQQISDAVKRENAKTSPGTYGNGEKIFNTKDKLYKVSLDSKCFLPGNMVLIS
jgi:hypothetical protein